MLCCKCETGFMVDDSHHDIKVIKCLVCGERVYAGHPKRWGDFVCSRCGDDLDEANELSLCQGCLNVLGIPTRALKKRTYGKTTCPCGTTFTRKSSTQSFHCKQCKSRRMHSVWSLQSGRT